MLTADALPPVSLSRLELFIRLVGVCFEEDDGFGVFYLIKKKNMFFIAIHSIIYFKINNLEKYSQPTLLLTINYLIRIKKRKEKKFYCFFY
jgi:hypothetical protein